MAYVPDTNASFWSHAYIAVEGTELVVRRTLPKARYFSFNIYQPTAVPIDSIYDAQLRPDKGTGNPFAGSKRGGTYTIHVLFTDKPKKPAPNTLYAGRQALQGAPQPGRDPSGRRGASVSRPTTSTPSSERTVTVVDAGVVTPPREHYSQPTPPWSASRR